MKYAKHMTLKEWNKFHKILKDSEGNFVPPGNDFQYRNHFTGKVESLQTITAQEVLLSKYKIIIEEFEPKWTRRYHKITKYVNTKNLVKTLILLDKSAQTFSKMAQVEKSTRKTKRRRKTFGVRNSQRTRRTKNYDGNERSFCKWLLYGDNSQ
ncbi:hypothetical protein OAI88_01555 [Nitrosopumilus sp.]|nr:hypothetical protein [Nitrosopumilus sp.]